MIDASYPDGPKTTNATGNGYLNYTTRELYASKITDEQTSYYTTNDLPDIEESEQEPDRNYSKVSFYDISRWDVSQIPQDRAEGMSQINNSTREYTFKIERLSVSRDFVRNISSPTDIKQEYIDKITSRDWNTSGEITVQVKNYDGRKRVRQVRYSLSGEDLDSEESLNIKYTVDFDYSTNDPPEDLTNQFDQ